MYCDPKSKDEPKKKSLNTNTQMNHVIGKKILCPSLPAFICKRCSNEILETSDIFMAMDKPFCRENCRRIFLNYEQYLSEGNS
jgi:hypothetical protein